MKIAVMSETVQRGLIERRKIGAFYTPARLSQLLASWAIKSAQDTVLEPSFGGCGFLEAARDALTVRGCTAPARQIFGCDIDPSAFEHLSTVFGSPIDVSGFLLKDFLACSSEPRWPDKFTTILANPPYIPHHRIPNDQLKSLAANPGAIRSVGGRSGSWAYFVSHAIHHLAEGGRMAWVLPGALLQADYAKPIREFISRHFERSAALIIRERIFLTEGTDEETVVLLADGYREAGFNGTLELGEVSTIEQLALIVARWDRSDWSGEKAAVSPAILSLTDESRRLLQELDNDETARRVGDIARVQIGIVTGDNKFFVLSENDLHLAGLEPEDCEIIVAKFKCAPGLALKKSDMDDYIEAGGRGFLVDSGRKPENERVAQYLLSFDAARLAEIATFRKRAVWSAPHDGKIPDAFFPVMHHDGPRIVLNDLRCINTNTVHRVFFLEDITADEKMLAAISMLTSYAQISAELVGRRYGSGVLKHEPRDAERIRMLMPSGKPEAIALTYSAIDERLRHGDQNGATILADTFIYTLANRDAAATSANLMPVLNSMRLRRRPSRMRD